MNITESEKSFIREVYSQKGFENRKQFFRAHESIIKKDIPRWSLVIHNCVDVESEDIALALGGEILRLLLEEQKTPLLLALTANFDDVVDFLTEVDEIDDDPERIQVIKNIKEMGIPVWYDSIKNSEEIKNPIVKQTLFNFIEYIECGCGGRTSGLVEQAPYEYISVFD